MNSLTSINIHNHGGPEVEKIIRGSDLLCDVIEIYYLNKNLQKKQINPGKRPSLLGSISKPIASDSLFCLWL